VRALLVALSFVSAAAVAAPAIPARPPLYVLDESGTLDTRARQALESLLIEHDRLTGERAMIAVFATKDGADPSAFASEVYRAWGLGRVGDSGALIAVYLREHEAALAVGSGLEALLASHEHAILDDFLLPELRRDRVARGLFLSTMHLLAALESPELASGAAESLLRAGGFEGSWTARPRAPSAGRAWVLWTVLGAALLAAALARLTSAEAHFASSGWRRERAPGPLAWLRERARKREGGPAAGGAFGSW
jgi:uncharacterized membrane protein YgcG